MKIYKMKYLESSSKIAKSWVDIRAFKHRFRGRESFHDHIKSFRIKRIEVTNSIITNLESSGGDGSEVLLDIVHCVGFLATICCLAVRSSLISFSSCFGCLITLIFTHTVFILIV
jgi:hypothetical protein